jgi:HEAT repeat protein
MKSSLSAMLAVLFVFTGLASGYPVGPPKDLEKLAAEADWIFKATAVSSAGMEDESFKPVSGFEPFETLFAVVSMIKGPPETKVVRFRHYDASPLNQPVMHQPQHYHFRDNGSYLVFAKKTDEPAACRQLWENHTSKEDLGVLRCADDQPAASGTVKEIFRAELMKLLRSPDPEDAIYGILQFDGMSDLPDPFAATGDFSREDVLKAVGPLMTHANNEVAESAITVVGSRNPYLADDRAQWWLGTVGVENPGLSKMDPKMGNAGGELYWKELVSIADGKGAVGNRALAIRALGLVRNAALVEPLKRWLEDPEPSVRAAAVLLLADYPGADAVKLLATLAADPAAEVRRCAAHAIGFMQRAELADTLATLLGDNDPQVRSASCQSLLSFSPKRKEVGKVFQANLGNEEFSPLFLNALAKDNPEPYLEPLARVVERKTEPRSWQGGQVPSFTAFNILFKYLQSQPAETVREGKFDRYLDAIEKGYSTGSSEPRDIYAFYLQRGMTERAKAYRAAAKKAASFDLDYYFNMVDKCPATYTR